MVPSSRSPVPTPSGSTRPPDLRGEDLTTVGEVVVSAGDRVPFVVSWYPSHRPVPGPVDAEEALERTESFWQEWSGGCGYEGEWAETGPNVDPCAEGTHVRADGRGRRRADDVACRNGSAVSGTGTTATAGSAMRR